VKRLSQISIQNLTFAYEGSYENIFENVSLEMDTSWKLGLIGRNGKGKTTFLRLLMGEFPFQGKILKTCEFRYFPYLVSESSKLTSELMREVAPQSEEWQWLKEFYSLNLSHVLLEQRFETLSSGEKTKVLLAALFLNQDTFLLIDEPTNHLDAHGRRIVGQYLQKKQGFIVVSHDRFFLDQCIDHIMVLNRMSIEIQRGTFSSWWMNKEWKDRFELDEDQKLRREIRKLKEVALRTAQWSDQVESTKFGQKGVDRGYIGHKAAKMMKKSKNTEKRAERSVRDKQTLLKDIEATEPLKIHSLNYPREKLLEVSDFSLFFGERIVCQNVRFSIEREERIAITGQNGSGKTSLLKWILDQRIEFRGNVYRGSQLKISYVPQDPTYLQGSLGEFIIARGIDETLLKTILRKMGFERSQFEKNMEDYSFGQKKKVHLAASLCEEAHLYLWDEPLNYLDIFTRIQLEELLLSTRPTMLFVEHDQVFVEQIATKKIVLS